MFCNTTFGDYPHFIPAPGIDGSQYGKEGKSPYFTGWMLLNYNKPVQVSSTLGGYVPNNAVDELTKTYWSAKTGHSLATFDDRWAPRMGRVTVPVGMDAGYDATPKPDQYLHKYVDVAYLPTEWPADKTRILIYSPTASSNQYTTTGQGAELSLSLSWPLAY